MTELSFILQCIELINTQLPESFIAQLFSTTSQLVRMRYTHNKQVLAQLLKISYVTLSVKSVPLMEEMYRYESNVPPPSYG